MAGTGIFDSLAPYVRSCLDRVVFIACAVRLQHIPELSSDQPDLEIVVSGPTAPDAEHKSDSLPENQDDGLTAP